MKNKLKYEYLIITSVGFLILKYNSFISISLIKSSKKLCRNSFYRNSLKRELRYYFAKKKGDIFFMFYLNKLLRYGG